MLKALSYTFLIMAAAIAAAWPARADELAPLPSPVTNNAVVGVKLQGQNLIYSFTGLGAAKTTESVTNAAYAFNLRYNKWTAVRSVPGTGRLGAVAVAVEDEVFLLGGYVPDKSGLQAIISDVSVYDPIGLKWFRGPDLPTPVRDAVAGVYRDRYIYVLGGYSKEGPTQVVQLYDSLTKKWLQATPLPSAVFGHAGAVVGDFILYTDGAKANGATTGARFSTTDDCWIGQIDRKDPKKVTWSKLPPHPGEARYRIAAGGADRENKIYFAGGSSTIFDFNGIGIDKKPAEPSTVIFDYNLRSKAWETITTAAPNPTMDHHGLVVTSDGLFIAGGMGADQKVEKRVQLLPKSAK